MLACDQTLTVVKYDDENEKYMATVIEGVSWFEKTQIKVAGTGVVYANAVQIRIPAAVVPRILPEVGDQVIKGELPLGFVAVGPADLAPYRPRKVVAIGDNRRGGLPHVSVVGQ